eukprot:TRINITY_DN6238_c0_g1_i5.p3 TRINITY_DN6238_c0_g1~~TRINITY_DN6238_c0_g1_i5.p3  ORF type:complete len:119 (-),score=5.47 TRINITY_DN6238_c0_g1_i5:37-393(-)
MCIRDRCVCVCMCVPIFMPVKIQQANQATNLIVVQRVHIFNFIRTNCLQSIYILEIITILQYSILEICIYLYIYIYLSLIHISEPTRLGMISYAVFCLKKKKKQKAEKIKFPTSKTNY